MLRATCQKLSLEEREAFDQSMHKKTEELARAMDAVELLTNDEAQEFLSKGCDNHRDTPIQVLIKLLRSVFPIAIRLMDDRTDSFQEVPRDLQFFHDFGHCSVER